MNHVKWFDVQPPPRVSSSNSAKEECDRNDPRTNHPLRSISIRSGLSTKPVLVVRGAATLAGTADT